MLGRRNCSLMSFILSEKSVIGCSIMFSLKFSSQQSFSKRTLRPQEYQFYHSLLNHIAEFGLQTRRFMARRVLRETLLRRRTLCYIFLFLFCFFFIVCSTASCCSSLIFNGFLFLGIRLGQISFKAFSNTSVNCKHCSYISRKY